MRCAYDIKTLDKASLVAELKKLDPIEQIRALQAFGMVRESFPDRGPTRGYSGVSNPDPFVGVFVIAVR